MRIYISGPITGNPTAHADFAGAVEFVRGKGHSPVNPFDCYPGSDYQEAMRADIAAMLGCEAIYLLPGWEHSAGARLEFLVAEACGLKIIYSGGLR